MFWERFYELCCRNNIKPNPLGKILGISSGVITKWKYGSLPTADALLKIADYFNVSVDYLVYGKTSDSSLRTDEEELLQNYNSVDTVAKARIRERAATLAELEAAKKNSDSKK